MINIQYHLKYTTFMQECKRLLEFFIKNFICEKLIAVKIIFLPEK